MWSQRTAFIAFSFVVHGAFAIGIGELDVQESHAATPIQLAEVKRPAKQPPPAKPKPRSVPQPAGSEAARAAGVEGKVRVQLTVDETGHVVDVKLLQGLGYGLDEAALAAARQAEFEPAVRCGKPTRATFNITMH